MKAVIDGRDIANLDDFHRKIADALSLPAFYGRNLNALYDCLTRDVERPVNIEWRESETSRNMLGDSFNIIIGIFDMVKNGDMESGYSDVFDYTLS